MKNELPKTLLRGRLEVIKTFFSLYCNKMLLIRRKEKAVDVVANIA